MTFPTYGSLVTKLNNDYDLSDENFISAAELLGLFNEGIRDCERIIHELHHEDKYFLNTGTISLVSGTSDYSFPTDIYGNKLRHVWYQNGSQKYEITKLRRVEQVKYSDTGNTYSFLVVNPTAGPKIRLYPTPAETGAYVQLFYIRECRRFVASTTDATNTLELPNGENLINQHARLGVARKMRRPELIAAEMQALTNQVSLFENSLKEMIPDENNLAQMDLSAYVSQGLELYNGGY